MIRLRPDGRLPVGYAFAVKETSEESHQIPYPTDAPCNMKRVFIDLISFLSYSAEQLGRLPPVYAFKNNIDITRNIMSACCTNMGYDENYVKVYSASYLFYYLRNGVCDVAERSAAFPSVNIATLELEKDVYDYTKGISCDFHENSDVPNHCSQSFVVRWAYIICNHCCSDLNITLIPGFHVPKHAIIPLGAACRAPDLKRARISLKNPCPTIGDVEDRYWEVPPVKDEHLFKSEWEDSADELCTRLSDVNLTKSEAMDGDKLGPGAYGSQEITNRELLFVTSSQESSVAASYLHSGSDLNDVSDSDASETFWKTKLRRPTVQSAGLNSRPSHSGLPNPDSGCVPRKFC